MWLSLCGGGGVHWVQVVQGAGLPEVALVLWCRVPAFCPLSRFALGALLANMPLFAFLRRFLAGFGALVWVYVVLVLCAVCVAFVCVNS